jgi:hypothetical protein
MSVDTSGELEQWLNRRFQEVSKLSAVHHTGKGKGLLSEKLEALSVDAVSFIQHHVAQAVQQARLDEVSRVVVYRNEYDTRLALAKRRRELHATLSNTTEQETES